MCNSGIDIFLMTHGPKTKEKRSHWTEEGLSHYKKDPTLPRMYHITE